MKRSNVKLQKPSRLVLWFKVAALAETVDDRTYVVVREIIPKIFSEYSKLMD